MKYLLPIICILCFLSCKKEQFETLEELLIYHHANAILDSTQIADLIKGDWRLIHYNSNYNIPSELPYATLSIDDTKGQIYYKEANNLAKKLDFDWQIEALPYPSEISAYQFLVTPHHNALYFQTFSKNYMSYYGFHGMLIVYERE